MAVLGARELKLLSAMESHPEASVTELAKVLRQKAPTVHYGVSRLRQRGLVSPNAFINSYRLGYVDVAIFFTKSEQVQRDRRALVKRFVEHPNVAYFGRLLGDYHFVAVFLCKHLDDFNRHLTEVVGGCGDTFADKLVAPRTASYSFSRKYLAGGTGRSRVLELKNNGDCPAVDDLDQRILSRLGNFPFESLRGLAGDVSAPVATVERRVRRLRELGVIAGIRHVLDVEQLGVHAFRLLVQVRGLCPHVRGEVLKFCTNHPNVTYLIESLGAWDFEIGVETWNAGDAPNVVEALYGVQDLRISWVRVLTEIEDLKCSGYPLLPAATKGLGPASMR